MCDIFIVSLLNVYPWGPLTHSCRHTCDVNEKMKLHHSGSSVNIGIFYDTKRITSENNSVVLAFNTFTKIIWTSLKPKLGQNPTFMYFSDV